MNAVCVVQSCEERRASEEESLCAFRLLLLAWSLGSSLGKIMMLTQATLARSGSLLTNAQ
jgi:hypothetical protein